MVAKLALLLCIKYIQLEASTMRKKERVCIRKYFPMFRSDTEL